MAVANIRLDKAYLTAIWLETLFYGEYSQFLSMQMLTRIGVNLCLFFSYLFIARYKRKRQSSKVIFYTAILMWIFSTIHVSMGFARLIEGFIYLRDEPGGEQPYKQCCICGD